jgi:hypothetical protein
MEVRDVVAGSLKEAIPAALERLASRELSDRRDTDTTEFADEFSHFLVDVEGDVDFEKSRFLTSAREALLDVLQRLVLWLGSDRSDALLASLIAECRSILETTV